MPCPDLSTLARVGTPQAEPAVVEHVRNCESCWLDWQIQQGARFLLDPQVRDAEELDERVVARAALIARHFDRPASWRLLAVTGFLVAAIVFLLLLVPNELSGPILIPYSALGALLAGAASVLYLRKRDEKECGVMRTDASVDSGARGGDRR